MAAYSFHVGYLSCSFMVTSHRRHVTYSCASSA